jgi:hypothetical protein
MADNKEGFVQFLNNIEDYSIVTSRSSSSYFATAITMNHYPMIFLPRQCSIATNLVWRLSSQWLQCQRGCSSSPCWGGNNNVWYITLHTPVLDLTQEPHNVHQLVVTSKMVDVGPHGAPLPAPPHETVNQMAADCCVRQHQDTVAMVRGCMV